MRLISILILSLISLITYSQDLVINEIMSSNGSAFYDEFGKTPDWIEIYNPNSYSVSLEDWYLSDDTDEPEKWEFPDTTIQANSFILILCDELDSADQYIHSNFKIDATGETITLYRENNLIDQFPSVQLDNNISFGRITDGNIAKDKFYKSSAGFSNNDNTILNPLYFSHETGFYQNNIDLQISTNNSNIDIYYTTNGNIPKIGTSYTKKYTEALTITDIQNQAINYSYIPTTPPDNDYYWEWESPIGEVEKFAVIRAQAYNDTLPSSEAITKSYFIDNYIGERFNMPVLSLITDSLNLFDYDTGIYVPGVNHIISIVKSGNYFMSEWERSGHISLLDEEGSLLLDKDVGYKIHGNLTSAAPQKSFKFIARNEIDGEDEFNLALFPDKDFTQYKHFISRTPYSSFLTDNFIHKAVKNLNTNTQACRPVVTYINGEYWGFQSLREKIDEFYIEQHYNVDKDSIDMIFTWGKVEHGNDTAYKELMAIVDTINMTYPENYEFLKDLIDIDEFIDYYSIEIYFNNRDWPTNNFMFWKKRGNGGKWRWILYDLDITCWQPEYNSYLRATGQDGISVGKPWSYNVFVKLLESEDFRESFVNRYAYLVNNEFTYEKIEPIIDYYSDIFDLEMQDHINRWGYFNYMSDWYNHINDIKDFLEARTCYTKEHTEDFFGIENCGIACEDYVETIETITVDIFPNPTQGKINISSKATIESISITDMTGKILITNTQINKKNILINISNLDKGVYLINITFADKSIVTKKISKI